MTSPERTGNYAGYMPYFYQAGNYLWQPMMGETAQQKLYDQPSGSYDFTSQPSLFARPQTVEQVIQKGYLAVPRLEPETAILADKQGTFWQGLDDIIRQVRHRYDIYNRHIYQIELGKCYALSSMWEQEAYRGGVPASGKEHYGLTKQLRELYEQERKERVTLWQDISKLKQTLPETAQQYLAAHRKVSILNGHGSDFQ